MKIIHPILYFVFFSLLISLTGMKNSKRQPVIIGYVGGYKGLVNVENIDARSLTHINYAFVNVKDSLAVLTNLKADSINFRKLNLLKRKNQNLKILISIGGWAWSENFSDAVLTETSRKAFAKSAVEIIKTYQLDGIDIDWEYPGMTGEEGNIYRPEDGQNYTMMFKALREELNKLQIKTQKQYQLTTAVGGSQAFLDHTDMKEASKYIDYVNLMTYDYYSSEIAGHHTNLYASKVYNSGYSADIAVNAYLEAGVRVSKLVMGIAFYGRNFTMVADAKVGLGEKIVSQRFGSGYSVIKDSLVNKQGFKEFRDEDARAPYLFNTNTREYITYDDEWSVNNKCKYVLDKGMAGVMFWEYDSDPKSYLLKEINKSLK
ncbi:MAG: chitinase [Sphingobacteriales bacterium]|nr:chitinase [Sphingobacteriales bacterium]